MSVFVSYAQNHEDVLLWRALQAFSPGFYVDVGANHPTDDSVTQAFYERGWRGINIEPIAQHHAQLCAKRPRDVNLRLAVGDRDGELELFDSSVRGRATASAEVAQELAAQGVLLPAQRVAVQRLSTVFATYAPQEVHFLKVDVEGYEREVLLGMDFQRYRPWVVVVEATRPGSREEDAPWEPLITQHAYRLVFFDGLNRYYLAQEHADLAGHFNAPVNVFDQYTTALSEARAQKAQQARREVERLQQTLREMQELLREKAANEARLQSAFRSAQEAHDRAVAQLGAVYASTSWRLMGPLRRVLRVAKRALVAWRTPDVVRADRLPDAAAADNPRGACAGAQESPGQPPQAVPRCDANSLPLRVLTPIRRQVRTESAADLAFRLVGHCEGHYSLSIVNRGVLLALQEQLPGRVRLVAHHGGPVQRLVDVPAHQLPDLVALQSQVLPAGCRTVSIAHHYPLVADPEPADLRLTLFFWEETRVPAPMVEQLQRQSDAVLVASRFVWKALRDSGCSLPIFVVPMGVSAPTDPGGNETRVPAPGPERRFRFLHVSSAFARKGVDVLIAAFMQAFTAEDAVELVIKTFPNPHNRVHDWIAREAAQHANAPQVLVDERELTQEELDALYRSADAVVLPTRGEGFNLPAAEAMLRGIPVVTTGHGAHTDFATRSTAWLLPFGFARAQSHVSSEQSCWVEPDGQALAQTMRTLYGTLTCRGEPTVRRLTRAQALVQSRFDWGLCAQEIRGVAAALLSPIRAGHTPEEWTLVALTPWATRCGIAEYSTRLLAPWATTQRLQVVCDDRTQPHEVPERCRVGWQMGNSESVASALREIAAQAPTAVLVQHQPSLFDLTPAVCQELEQMARAGTVVLLELHATLPLLQAHRLSPQAVASLSRLDRILVHQVEDLNRLLSLGLAQNTLLLEHGVTQPQCSDPAINRAALGIPDDAWLLGSFGFLLEHKGIDILIESLPAVSAALRRPVHFLAVNAVMDARSQTVLQHCRALADRLGVARSVHWVTDYRSIEESIRLLSLCDGVAFPYRHTLESASGAVTIGLAALRPVMVSDAPIFRDLAGFVWTLPAANAQAVVQSVVSMTQDPHQAQEKLNQQAAWLAQRDWRVVGMRFKGLVEGLLCDRFWHAPALEAEVGNTDAPGLCQTRQLLVDVSELMLRDARTGIQRVVRNVIKVWSEAPPPGFRLQLVGAQAGSGYRCVDRLGDWYAANDGLGGQPVEVDCGDVFLGLDLSAHLFPQAQAELARWRRMGVRVCFVVYDLIPLLHPQWTTPGLTAAFERWMTGLSLEADRLVAISAAVAADVKTWLHRYGPPGRIPSVGYFHLGADGEWSGGETATADADPPDAVELFSKTRPTLLMVGTVEPRKGHAQALDAVELLWKRGVDLNLVVVGKAGWMVEDLVARMRQHEELGARLHWLETADDRTLEKLYASCDGLLAASFAEGFGLPLIEAAQRNLPILARDIAVFREIAQEHAFYFDAQDAADLAAAISQWLGLFRAGMAPGSGQMPYQSWPQAAERLLATALVDP